LLLLVVPSAARERLTTTAGASFRLDTWRGTLRMAAASPWAGHGLGSFADAYPRFKEGHGELRVEHAENDYLETLAEAGIPRLALALSALLVPARIALIARPSSPLRGLAAGSLGGLAALLVHSAFDFDLRIPSNAVMAALLVSMALAGVAVRTTSAWTARALAALFGLAVLASVPRAAFPVDPDAGWEAAREEARLAAA